VSGIFNQPNVCGPANAQNQLEAIEWLELIEAQLRLLNAQGGTNNGGGSTAPTALKAKLSFTAGDVAQRLIYTPVAGELITRVVLIVLAAFDSPTAMVSVGDTAEPERLMPMAAVSLSEAATWITHPNYQYSASQGINLYYAANGATQGQAIVFVYAD
jgi:hypothetical protein